MQARRELAQLLQRRRQLLLRRGEQARLVGVGREVHGEEPELDRERDEPLLGAVVQVALEPPALGVAGADDARARPVAASSGGAAG